ncbi:heat shock 70 kDa protein 12B-like [Ruditapes philippinarum]|uniref:heat shock 70 kDa protein 12B-like n=1 Tax=Ruditapes philippinarum TaxID=129788 RepID=UPI00295B39BF|nr:heat shock 70 kDa protein 12B-like [Ruditapes philippinarum]
MTIEDEFGRSLLAADVFGISIKFLVDDMLNAVNKGIHGLFKPSEIHVVITVPAIWSDAAKQFMREATKKAEITKERLTMALESEVASLYCRHLHIHKPCELSNACMDKLPIGTKYIVLDAGGGTIDVTVHEIKSEHTLREVRPASGGDWGCIMVDKEFENLVERIVGEKVFEKFKQEEKEDWLDMQREFELKKRETKVNSADKIRMRFPLSLTKLYEKHSEKDSCTSLASSGYAGKINLKNDKMTIPNTVFVELFDKSVTKTISHLKSLLAEDSFKEARILLMVGGYSESLVLQHAVIEALPKFKS